MSLAWPAPAGACPCLERPPECPPPLPGRRRAGVLGRVEDLWARKLRILSLVRTCATCWRWRTWFAKQRTAATVLQSAWRARQARQELQVGDAGPQPRRWPGPASEPAAGGRHCTGAAVQAPRSAARPASAHSGFAMPQELRHHAAVVRMQRLFRKHLHRRRQWQRLLDVVHQVRPPPRRPAAGAPALALLP
jgi:hypothetical protein